MRTMIYPGSILSGMARPSQQSDTTKADNPDKLFARSPWLTPHTLALVGQWESIVPIELSFLTSTEQSRLAEAGIGLHSGRSSTQLKKRRLDFPQGQKITDLLHYSLNQIRSSEVAIIYVLLRCLARPRIGKSCHYGWVLVS